VPRKALVRETVAALRPAVFYYKSVVRCPFYTASHTVLVEIKCINVRRNTTVFSNC
jgi:hypothetical protein